VGHHAPLHADRERFASRRSSLNRQTTPCVSVVVASPDERRRGAEARARSRGRVAAPPFLREIWVGGAQAPRCVPLVPGRVRTWRPGEAALPQRRTVVARAFCPTEHANSAGCAAAVWSGTRAALPSRVAE
jgi:hypothetical protein